MIIKNIEQAQREIKRLEELIETSKNKIIDLTGYIIEEERLKK